MISVNAAHAALLASLRPLVMVELLTITLADGTVHRYCNSPVSLSYGGQTYVPLSFERGDITTCIGLEVDNVELIVYPRVYPISCDDPSTQDEIGGASWVHAARTGLLYESEVLLQRGDIDPEAGPDIVGALYLFSGRIAEPSFDNGLHLVIKSDLEVLNRQVPSQLYQPGCPFVLYDDNCGLDPDDWVVSGVVTGTSSARQVVCDLTDVAEWFSLGRMEFTSGANVGIRRTVRTYEPGLVQLAGSLLAAPSIGDVFNIWPGCDKIKETCDTKFSNTVVVDGQSVLRYGGQCFIPKPEAAY